MRKSYLAVLIAMLILGVATAGSLAIAACGGSSDETTSSAQGGPPGASDGQRPDRSAMLTQALDQLVEDGTITSAQEEAVVTAITASLPDRSGASGAQAPSPGATPDAGSRPDPGSMFTSALDDLVDAGTITADQEKAIVSALSSNMGGGGQGGAPPQSGDSSSTQSY